MAASAPEEGSKQGTKLAKGPIAGQTRREKLHQALKTKRQELESLGLVYNHWYTSSAIYLADEHSARPALEGDPIVEVQVTTYPGSRLPHACIDIPTRGRMILTVDLAGEGAFYLITGVGGQAWRDAAGTLQGMTGIPIKSFGIAPRLEFIDVRREWFKVRRVDDDGLCLLDRTDS